MQKILSVKEMRESDAATIRGGIPGRELMYRAGAAIIKASEEYVTDFGKVGIVCGSGNNAGDGYVIALLLWEREIPCKLILVEDRFSDDGRFYFDMCLDRGIAYEICGAETDFSSYNTLFDCIYGTGFHGDIKEPVSSIIHAINASREGGTFVIAVDINSGLNGNTGMTNVCVKSDLTVSVGNCQPGHYLNRAKDCIKKLCNCPIGIEPVSNTAFLFEKEDAAQCFPERANFSNKGTYGYIALIGGSLKYSGAVRLASMAEEKTMGDIAEAAMRSGAGVVSVAVSKSIACVVASHVLESTLFPLSDEGGQVIFDETEIAELIKNKKTVAFGIGIGKSDETAKILKYLLHNYKGTLIVDADGLNCLAETDYEGAVPKLVLTPHIKEFSRLTGKSISDIQNSPLEIACEYATGKKVILLLKGPSTIVTDGETTYIVSEGCPGMATAGSGDVLSGILAAVCAFNEDKILKAVAAGAYINGRAGELAQKEVGAISMLAGDTVCKIPEAIKETVDKDVSLY